MLENEQDAIRAVLASYVVAWQENEMVRWGELFTTDADFITWRGIWWTSRDEIVAEHNSLSAEIVSQLPNYRLTPLKLELLAPTVALVHAEWRWPGFVEADQAPENRRGLLTMVMIKREGRWQVRASQNCRIMDNGEVDDHAADA